MFNRSKIMTAAWAIVRNLMNLYRSPFRAALLSRALRTAWGQARFANYSPGDRLAVHTALKAAYPIAGE